MFTLTVGMCGCKKKAAPPDLSMIMACVDGAPEVQVVNGGGSMAEHETLTIEYQDGTSDSLDLQLAADQSLSCTLSNLHGSLHVESEGMALSGDAADCLTPKFQNILEKFGGELDLTSWIPVPLMEQNLLTCDYTFYLEDMAYERFLAEVSPIDGGIRAQIFYGDISADIRTESDGLICADLSGGLTISQIVFRTDILLDSGNATFANIEVDINGLDIAIDGPMGVLADAIMNLFGNFFVTTFEAEFATDLESTLAPTISAILINEKRCE
jgi:hypothetical protein